MKLNFYAAMYKNRSSFAKLETEADLKIVTSSNTQQFEMPQSSSRESPKYGKTHFCF
jgi:hypothetical protein